MKDAKLPWSNIDGLGSPSHLVVNNQGIVVATAMSIEHAEFIIEAANVLGDTTPSFRIYREDLHPSLEKMKSVRIAEAHQAHNGTIFLIQAGDMFLSCDGKTVWGGRVNEKVREWIPKPEEKENDEGGK